MRAVCHWGSNISTQNICLYRILIVVEVNGILASFKCQYWEYISHHDVVRPVVAASWICFLFFMAKVFTTIKCSNLFGWSLRCFRWEMPQRGQCRAQVGKTPCAIHDKISVSSLLIEASSCVYRQTWESLLTIVLDRWSVSNNSWI